MTNQLLTQFWWLCRPTRWQQNPELDQSISVFIWQILFAYWTNTFYKLDKYIYNVYHLQIWPINFLPDSNGSALLDIDHKTRGQSFDQNIFLRFNQRNHLSFVSTRVFAAFGRWTQAHVGPEYRLRRSWVTHSRNQGFEQPFRCSDLVFEIYPSLFLDSQPYMTHLFS